MWVLSLRFFLNFFFFFLNFRKEKKYVDRCWKDVTVGDFIHLSCNEIIPADMVLLFSTDPDGICHIETSGLDGESNLKQKQVVRRYAEQVKNVFSVGDINIFFSEDDWAHFHMYR